MADFGDNDEFWLFGYGSLIWKPPPHYDQRIPGYIDGYVRRFWQSSEDHRGTPEAPGRVVTLIDRAHWETLVDHHDSLPTEKVWGAAYHIPAPKVAEVRAYLDLREIMGYSIQYTLVHPAASSRLNATEPRPKPIKCLVYIGLPCNPQFLGPQDPQELAARILKCKGPSGENIEYLYMLETALLDLSAESEDGHISDLASRCRKLEASQSKGLGKSEGLLGQPEVETSLHKAGSTEEQEEVEK
ncbi:ChaC-like protein [Glonium stellatum]|uniref:glutathione-specific gamma-glutamylcyclotransferase n=1 Tax=Glonium stellatum TaxID=574774 RepID=A0A8E2F4J6_9PEZI|nr:ChaC-like protein [Glonium stellatum]